MDAHCGAGVIQKRTLPSRTLQRAHGGNLDGQRVKFRGIPGPARSCKVGWPLRCRSKSLEALLPCAGLSRSALRPGLFRVHGQADWKPMRVALAVRHVGSSEGFGQPGLSTVDRQRDSRRWKTVTRVPNTVCSTTSDPRPPRAWMGSLPIVGGSRGLASGLCDDWHRYGCRAAAGQGRSSKHVPVTSASLFRPSPPGPHKHSNTVRHPNEGRQTRLHSSGRRLKAALSRARHLPPPPSNGPPCTPPTA